MGTHDLDTHRVVQAPDVLLQDLAGEAVLLNLENGLYYGLDEVGFRMFNLLVSSDSVQAAYEQLLQEYEVEPERLRSDLEQLLGNLLQNGLVLNADRRLD